MSIKDNIENVRRRIGGREVKLVAAIKNIPLEQVFEALEAGITDLGENRIQEAEERYAAIKARYPAVTFHLIGHLQRNKVRQALDMFDIIQSVDSERLAEEIARRALKPIPILIEVNTSGETAKFGVEPDRAIELAGFASSFKNLKVQGLMTVGPLTGDREGIRKSFRLLRELRDKIGLPVLSMGMTDDFEIAIEEGSNLVRIGRALFKGG